MSCCFMTSLIACIASLPFAGFDGLYLDPLVRYASHLLSLTPAYVFFVQIGLVLVHGAGKQNQNV